MADRSVADDIDDRSLARSQCALERGTELLGPLDVLAVTVHEFEHLVVALVQLDFERIGPTLQEGHFFEAWPPGTVVPQHGYDWEPISARGFEIEPADAQTPVADDQHDLLSRPSELSTDRHADAVADGRKRTRVKNSGRGSELGKIAKSSRSS